MKLLIVSAWRDRYDGDRRARTLPSLSAIPLAAPASRGVKVAVAHEHVRALAAEAVDAAGRIWLQRTTGAV